MNVFRVLIIICFIQLNTQIVHSKSTVKTGEWEAFLHLTKETKLPVRLHIDKKDKKYSYTIVNADEKIKLIILSTKGDSIELRFPDFNSSIIIKQENKTLNGYWINYEKENYKIPFSAFYTKNLKTTTYNNLDGKWECTFDEKTQDEYKAIGVFNSDSKIVTGTFLTETGDYRFLEGSSNNKGFYLSCFDGSHAFLFTGINENGKLIGDFYSGKHFHGKWNGKLNPEFELRDPTKLTYLVTEEPFHFDVLDLDKKNFHFPNEDFKNKVVIVQILGTWCPNCLDETKFFNQLYTEYNRKGLEIISIGYELKSDFESQAIAIKRLRDRYNLPFTFLVGGNSDKNLVAKHFPMLNDILSFPTTLFIDKKGEVRKIYTGFSGPGTGEVYTNYVKEINLFLEELLSE